MLCKFDLEPQGHSFETQDHLVNNKLNYELEKRGKKCQGKANMVKVDLKLDPLYNI